jgi:electron transport complex protein RnfA
MKTLLLTIAAAAFVNNCALEGFLGVEQVLGFSKGENRVKRLSLWVIGVMLILSLLSMAIEPLVADLEYLRLLVYVALVLAIVYVIELLLKRAGKSAGFYFPLVALNSAVLSLALDTSRGISIAGAVGTGLGFALALLLMQGVQSQIHEKYVPKAFRGLPVSLLAASIISMVLVAFK